MKGFTVLSFAAAVLASPCPYGQLAESGALTKKEAEHFYNVRAEGESAVEAYIAKREAEHNHHKRQEEYYNEQVKRGELLLGGGLLGGILQPFTGILEALDVPTPQQTGLRKIPGEDANHVYLRPAPDAVRGMCPTLNTMANHGFISRDGITTFAEAANACQITLGFGYDTCIFLSALGLLTGGDLPSGKYSIGGADSRVPNTLGPSLGISRHGFFEVDNSISRVDYALGNQANFNLPRFQKIQKIAAKYNGNFGLETWKEERVMIYNEAKNNNPTFDAGVRWLAVTAAERVFIYRAMPNGTNLGVADAKNVLPFYLNETFPAKWFTRPTPYSLAATGADIASLLADTLLDTPLGQNQGIGNFVPLGADLDAFTPETAVCFLATTILDQAPGSLSPVLAGAVDVVNGFIQGALKPFFATYNCDMSAFAVPGKNAKIESADGVSTNCNYLRNGVYQC
jgi:hypothetical protein